MFTTNIEELKTSVSAGPPVVYNYLRPNAFRFVIKDLPRVAYTCQSANLPQLALGSALQTTPFVDVPVFGDKLTYGDFAIRFLIAEDMSNYLELLEWMIALGFPNNYNDYSAFAGERLNRFPFVTASGIKQTGGIAYSDATLTILDSNNIPKTEILFKDVFPISVEALDFDITSSTVEYFVGIASFKYTTFEVKSF